MTSASREKKSVGKKAKAGLVHSPLGVYGGLLKDIKTRIRAAQVRAAFASNAEMLRLYWDIGRILAERQEQAGWGAAVIPRLARDLANELPTQMGFSERNLRRKVPFFHEYHALTAIWPRPVAKLPETSPGTEIGPLAVAKLDPLGCGQGRLLYRPPFLSPAPALLRRDRP